MDVNTNRTRTFTTQIPDLVNSQQASDPTHPAKKHLTKRYSLKFIKCINRAVDKGEMAATLTPTSSDFSYPVQICRKVVIIVSVRPQFTRLCNRHKYKSNHRLEDEVSVPMEVFGVALDEVLGNVLLLLHLALDHDGVEELLHTVGVPLGDGQLLSNLLVLIKQLQKLF